MRGGGLFSSEGTISAFLVREAQPDPSPNRFIARNFLLDEVVGAERVDSYRNAGAAQDHATFADWQAAHGAYLASQVFRPSMGHGLPPQLDPADPDLCPETFRRLDEHSPFLASAGPLHLIRVEELAFIAREAGVTPVRLRNLVEATHAAGASDDTRRRLDDVLDEWARHIELRPVFSAFWEDLKDLLPDVDPPVEWPDALRDRMGLAHLDPGQRGAPIDVVVFRYAVKEVPALRGRPGLRPLVPPTVLDGRFSTAFCPAPRGASSGHTLDLNASSPLPRREVLHPGVPFHAGHLRWIGAIRRPVDPDLLDLARGQHLAQIRTETARLDYAEETDGDLK